ncbi:aspartate/glutamate racemase family protein [Streptomyces shenzhenensis]|uniref:aspartate/glutamate racemase family protein n=1 Tax=Streptomyces shenzhenensis TaxID=943815 RepID=UPI003400141A
MTRVLLLAPVGTDMHLAAEEHSARRAVRADTHIEVRHLAGLPETVYVPPEELFVPVLVRAAVAAERAGYDAVGISCCSDPGLDEVRAAVSIPVTAPFEAARALLPALAPLCVLYVDVPPGAGESDLAGADWVPELAARYGMTHLITEPQPVSVPRPAVERTDGRHTARDVGEALIAAQRYGLERHGPAVARRAEAAGARGILPACTYWTGTTDALTAVTRLPVLDPVELLARHAESLALAARVHTG